MFVHSQRAAGAENAAERSSLNGPLRARSKDFNPSIPRRGKRYLRGYVSIRRDVRLYAVN